MQSNQFWEEQGIDLRVIQEVAGYSSVADSPSFLALGLVCCHHSRSFFSSQPNLEFLERCFGFFRAPRAH